MALSTNNEQIISMDRRLVHIENTHQSWVKSNPKCVITVQPVGAGESKFHEDHRVQVHDDIGKGFRVGFVFDTVGKVTLPVQRRILQQSHFIVEWSTRPTSANFGANRGKIEVGLV